VCRRQTVLLGRCYYCLFAIAFDGDSHRLTTLQIASNAAITRRYAYFPIESLALPFVCRPTTVLVSTVSFAIVSDVTLTVDYFSCFL